VLITLVVAIAIQSSDSHAPCTWVQVFAGEKGFLESDRNPAKLRQAAPAAIEEAQQQLRMLQEQQQQQFGRISAAGRTTTSFTSNSSGNSSGGSGFKRINGSNTGQQLRNGLQDLMQATKFPRCKCTAHSVV
jgi:hypothetical protein